MVHEDLLYMLQEGEFPGLIPLVNSYLSSMDVDADTHCTIQQYLKLINRRASGELLTTARWIREQVVTHPLYKLALIHFANTAVYVNMSFVAGMIP
jgi:hypothetical protein